MAPSTKCKFLLWVSSYGYLYKVLYLRRSPLTPHPSFAVILMVYFGLCYPHIGLSRALSSIQNDDTRSTNRQIPPPPQPTPSASFQLRNNPLYRLSQLPPRLYFYETCLIYHLEKKTTQKHPYNAHVSIPLSCVLLRTPRPFV